MTYRLFVNATSTVLVRIWDSGRVEACQRDNPDDIWGPPTVLTSEHVADPGLEHGLQMLTKVLQEHRRHAR